MSSLGSPIVGGGYAYNPKNVGITGGMIGNTPVGGVPTVVSATSYAVVASDEYLVFTAATTITLTLPSAAANAGRVLWVKTITAAVNSASSNIINGNGSTVPTSAIVVAGNKWCGLVCDGTNWATFAFN